MHKDKSSYKTVEENIIQDFIVEEKIYHDGVLVEKIKVNNGNERSGRYYIINDNDLDEEALYDLMNEIELMNLEWKHILTFLSYFRFICLQALKLKPD